MVWHERYLACCNELAQWDMIAELGKATGDSPTLLDSLWKLGDYGLLSQRLLHGAAVWPFVVECI